jgi:hypothetical protein
VLSAAQQELLLAAVEEMRASKTNFHTVCLGWDLTKKWRTSGARVADITVIDPSDGETLHSYKQIRRKLEASSGGQLGPTTVAPATAPSSHATCTPPAAAVCALAAGLRVLARFRASDALRQSAEPDERGGRGAVLHLRQTQWYAGVIREVRTRSHMLART